MSKFGWMGFHFFKKNPDRKLNSLPERFYRGFDRTQSLTQKVVTSRSFTEKFHKYSGEHLHCLQIILRLSNSLLRGILPWVILSSSYGLLISLLDRFGYLLYLKELKALPQIVIILNIVLSLLLAFRTNTAHQQFWEGRKLWGAMVNTVRNLARDIWVVIQEWDIKDRNEKEAAVKLVAAFSISTKLHLRGEPVNFELASLMSPWQYQKLRSTNHPSLEIAFWIGDYLQQQHERQKVNVFQLTALQKQLDDLVDILGGCERISKTPAPLMYAIALNTLLLIYFLLLPLGLVQHLAWLTVPIVAVISFLIFGINEIGAEIEQPFGYDPNDLPLDLICYTILGNIEELLTFDPNHRFPLRKIRKLKNILAGRHYGLPDFFFKKASFSFDKKIRTRLGPIARILPWWKAFS